MNKTDFDLFLEEQLSDPDFAERFKRAGEAWDVALQLAALREKGSSPSTLQTLVRRGLVRIEERPASFRLSGIGHVNRRFSS